MTNGAGAGGNASGSDNDAMRREKDVRTPGGQTAASTPVPGGSKSASPGMKEQPDDGKKPGQR